MHGVPCRMIEPMVSGTSCIVLRIAASVFFVPPPETLEPHERPESRPGRRGSLRSSPACDDGGFVNSTGFTRSFLTGAASGHWPGHGRGGGSSGGRLLPSTDVDAEGVGAGGGVPRRAVVLAEAADVSDHGAVRRLAERITREHGAMDVVMNIAGISAWGTVQSLEHETWRRQVEVNLMGPIHVIEELVPPMVEAGRGGHLVNVSSAAGVIGMPWHAAYSASKFGLRGVSEVLRFDLARHGIGVSLVCPGAVAHSPDRDGAHRRRRHLDQAVPPAAGGLPQAGGAPRKRLRPPSCAAYVATGTGSTPPPTSVSSPAAAVVPTCLRSTDASRQRRSQPRAPRGRARPPGHRVTSPDAPPRRASGRPQGHRPADLKVFSRLAGRVTRSSPPRIFTTLGRHRRLFWGWLHFAGRLMPGGRLPRVDTELVILRVAAVRGSDYELGHHSVLGASRQDCPRTTWNEPAPVPGQPGGALASRCCCGPPSRCWSSATSTTTSGTSCGALLDERGCIELLLLVGHYDMLATTLTVLRVQPEEHR